MFEKAIKLLIKSKSHIKNDYYYLFNQLGTDSTNTSNASNNYNSESIYNKNQYMRSIYLPSSFLNAISISTHHNSDPIQIRDVIKKDIHLKLTQEIQANIISTVYSLLAVSVYRDSPTEPEVGICMLCVICVCVLYEFYSAVHCICMIQCKSVYNNEMY